MNIIKSFELDEDSLKAALQEWLNTCVLREPCEVDTVKVDGPSYNRSVSVTLKEKKPKIPTLQEGTGYTAAEGPQSFGYKEPSKEPVEDGGPF